jgi:hypothetical protein
MFQFEFVQVLTRGQQRTLAGNTFKDIFYTPILNAGLDGRKAQVKAANTLTLGGYNEMRKNAAKFEGVPEN